MWSMPPERTPRATPGAPSRLSAAASSSLNTASALLTAAVVLVGLGAPRPAEAYPWMIHHGYTACAQCHIDPSGSGILTDYGRAQGEILLRTQYGEPNPSPEKVSSFLFGALPLGDKVELQPDVRALLIPEPGNLRFIVMQADMRAAVQIGKFLASGSLGGVSEGAEEAWITSNDAGWNLVAREYWVGYNPTRSIGVRAGRMNLPFGIRTEDHILYPRAATGTTINDDQQVGASFVYQTRKVRAEVMGIAGNFQVSPDDFRKRGYSAYGAYSVSKTLEVGASSLFTMSKLDTDTLAPRTFISEGVFVRAAPVQPLAIMAEADFMIDDQDGDKLNGLTGMGILDYEPLQGLHVQGIGQYCDSDLSSSAAPAWTGGLGAQWFFAPRVDLRADVAQGMLYCTQGEKATPYGLLQAHFYL